jgi:hypothetical protein
MGWKYNINRTSNYNYLSIQLKKMIERIEYYWIRANLRLQSISILTEGSIEFLLRKDIYYILYYIKGRVVSS